MTYYPPKYYKGLSKAQKRKRKREIERRSKMDHDNASAYASWATNEGVEPEQESPYTRLFHERYENPAVSKARLIELLGMLPDREEHALRHPAPGSIFPRGNLTARQAIEEIESSDRDEYYYFPGMMMHSITSRHDPDNLLYRTGTTPSRREDFRELLPELAKDADFDNLIAMARNYQGSGGGDTNRAITNMALDARLLPDAEMRSALEYIYAISGLPWSGFFDPEDEDYSPLSRWARPEEADDPGREDNPYVSRAEARAIIEDLAKTARERGARDWSQHRHPLLLKGDPNEEVYLGISARAVPSESWGQVSFPPLMVTNIHMSPSDGRSAPVVYTEVGEDRADTFSNFGEALDDAALVEVMQRADARTELLSALQQRGELNKKQYDVLAQMMTDALYREDNPKYKFKGTEADFKEMLERHDPLMIGSTPKGRRMETVEVYPGLSEFEEFGEGALEVPFYMEEAFVGFGEPGRMGHRPVYFPRVEMPASQFGDRYLRTIPGMGPGPGSTWQSMTRTTLRKPDLEDRIREAQALEASYRYPTFRKRPGQSPVSYGGSSLFLPDEERMDVARESMRMGELGLALDLAADEYNRAMAGDKDATKEYAEAYISIGFPFQEANKHLPWEKSKFVVKSGYWGTNELDEDERELFEELEKSPHTRDLFSKYEVPEYGFVVVSEISDEEPEFFKELREKSEREDNPLSELSGMFEEIDSMFKREDNPFVTEDQLFDIVQQMVDDGYIEEDTIYDFSAAIDATYEGVDPSGPTILDVIPTDMGTSITLVDRASREPLSSSVFAPVSLGVTPTAFSPESLTVPDIYGDVRDYHAITRQIGRKNQNKSRVMELEEGWDPFSLHGSLADTFPEQSISFRGDVGDLLDAELSDASVFQALEEFGMGRDYDWHFYDRMGERSQMRKQALEEGWDPDEEDPPWWKEPGTMPKGKYAPPSRHRKQQIRTSKAPVSKMSKEQEEKMISAFKAEKEAEEILQEFLDTVDFD